MSKESASMIWAEVILRSKSGQSLARPKVAVTAENIEEFTPTPEAIREARRRLEQLGFGVSQSDLTLTIVAKKKQFEEVFKTKIAVENYEPTGGIMWHPETELVIPDSLRDLVEKVVPPERYEFHP